MGVLTLNANSYYNFGRGAWGVSSGAGLTSSPQAVNSANGVYARLSSNYTAGGHGASLKFRVAPAQLPGGAKVEWMKPGFTIRTSNATQEAYFRAMIQNIRGGSGTGSNAVTWSDQLKIPTSFGTVYGVTEKTTKSNNKVYGDGSITQTDINNLVVEAFDITQTVIQIDRMWIEVSYDLKPTINVVSPGTVSETTSPTIAFEYDDDKMPLAAIDVVLKDGNGNVLHTESKLAVESPSYGVPLALEDGDYSIEIRAYQKWNYAGEAPVSDWDSATFSVEIGRPAVPEFVVTEEPDNARVKLVAKTNLNLLSVGGAEGAPAAWNDTFNCTVITGDEFVEIAGDRSLMMDVTSGGVGYMKAFSVPLIPVVAGTFYAFGFKAKAWNGDTLSTVQAGIRWLNAAGAQISESYGSSILEIYNNWVDVVVNTQAPVGAVHAKPFISVNSSQTNGWHYIDALQLQAQAAFAEPLPVWSRGGFATVPSINLLSYGDSSLEGISHWTAVDAEAGSKAGSVGVVNVVAEAGDITESYQGDNMLKLSTIDTLIKRDIEPNFATGTAINVSKGDTLDGDYMVVFVQVQTAATTVTPPAGWTTLTTTTGSSQRVYTFGKFASNEPATLTFTASASGKHAIALYSWSGIDTTTPIYFNNAPSPTAALAAGANITFATATVPHNGPVITGLFGRRVASTVATSFTSNLGGNNDILLSTTNNTAAEVASGIFSRKYDTGTTTDLSLSGRTMSAAHALTDVIPIILVLRPDRSTVRATLRDYEYYEYDDTSDYVIHAAVMGASHSGATSANRQVSLLLDLYDDNKNFVNGYYVGQLNATPGKWVKMSSISNIPPNPTARWATIRLEVDQMTDFEAYYFDAISLYESSTNIGYLEGFKEEAGPYLELEYTEDDEETWKTAYDVDGESWMLREITDFHDATIEFYDHEIASEKPRKYRFKNWKIEEGFILTSDYSAVKEAEIKLRRIWIHLITDPAGSIHHFLYDGTGRDDEYSKNSNVLHFAGREFGQVHYGETSEENINANVQLPSKLDIVALRKLDREKTLVIFRDGRGRRVKGEMKVRFSDTKWGATASISIQVYGLQP